MVSTFVRQINTFVLYFWATLVSSQNLHLPPNSGQSPSWASGEAGKPDGSSGPCTCETPCDLNTISYEDLNRLLLPLNLSKVNGKDGNVLAYRSIVEKRPICNPMELATTKRVWVRPTWLPQRPRPAPGYLLIALFGCSGNQGLYGTIGGRGGCCPVTASSLYCGLKNYFGEPDLQKPYSKDQYNPSCTIMLPYTKSNPPPWCYVRDRLMNFDTIRTLTEVLIKRGVGEQWEDREISALIDKLDLPTVRNRGNGDRQISEEEFMRFMGKGYLKGLPRRAYVREPWERTNASTYKEEELRKCSMFYGTDACLGSNKVLTFSFDRDDEAVERKKHPDCLMKYEYGAYSRVKSGEVYCQNSTWYPRSQTQGTRTRCGCYPPPLTLIPSDAQLFPGCANTQHSCLTPPDWSEYS